MSILVPHIKWTIPSHPHQLLPLPLCASYQLSPLQSSVILVLKEAEVKCDALLLMDMLLDFGVSLLIDVYI